MLWYLFLLPNARRRHPVPLSLLISGRQLIILCLDPGNLPLPLPPLFLVFDLQNQLCQALPFEKLVRAIIQLSLPQRLFSLPLGLYSKHLLQNVDVIRNAKQVPRILIRKQIVKFIEARPRDSAQT